MSPVPPLIALMRPKQWSKNLLVLAAIIFVGKAGESAAWPPVLLTLLGMCLLSSSVYVLNDLMDAQSDRRHPTKRHRPIASGAIHPTQAAIFSKALALAGIITLMAVNIPTVIGGAVYVAMQFLYNIVAKRVAVLDVFVISLGFVLRAVMGALALDVRISGWLLLCTGALALTLAFGKRRSEFLSQDGTETRSSLAQYSQKALDHLVASSALGAALCYGMYALESPTGRAHPGLIFTTPFVFYGVCRYVLLVFRDDNLEEPESLLLRDPHIWVSVVGFMIVAVLAMTGLRAPILE